MGICCEPKTPLEKLAFALLYNETEQPEHGNSYPDDWAIYGDVIAIASVDHKGAPYLRMCSVVEYVTEEYMENEYHGDGNGNGEGPWPEEFQQLYRQCLADPVFRQVGAARKRIKRRDQAELDALDVAFRKRLREEIERKKSTHPT